MNRLMLVVGTLGFVVAVVDGQGPAAQKVEVISLEIGKPLPSDDELLGGHRSGTTLGILVTLPGKHIVSVDSAATNKQSSFTDNSGNDLTKGQKLKAGQIPPPPGFAVWPRVAKGGDRCSITIRAGGTPAVEANNVRLKGNLVFLCGTDKKTLEAKDVALDDRLNMQLGPFKLTWGENPGGFDFGPRQPGILVNWQGDQSIATFEIVTADGQKLTPERTSLFSTTVNGKRSQSAQYSVTGANGGCIIRVNYFDKLESIPVPVDVQVGLGF